MKIGVYVASDFHASKTIHHQNRKFDFVLFATKPSELNGLTYLHTIQPPEHMVKALIDYLGYRSYRNLERVGTNPKSIGYIIYESRVHHNKPVAISWSVFPKEFPRLAESKVKVMSRKTKGLGSILELACTKYLKQKGAAYMQTTEEPDDPRQAQLAVGKLPIGKPVKIEDWEVGLHKIIRKKLGKDEYGKLIAAHPWLI